MPFTSPSGVPVEPRFGASRRRRLRSSTATGAALVIIVALGDAGARGIFGLALVPNVPLDLWIALVGCGVLLTRPLWRARPHVAALLLGVLVVNNTLLTAVLAGGSLTTSIGYSVMAIVAAAVLFPWGLRLHSLFLASVVVLTVAYALIPSESPLTVEPVMVIVGSVVVSAVTHRVLLTTAVREHAHSIRLRDSRRALTEQSLRLAASEADLAEAQAVAGVGSWEWDLSTGTLHWSAEMRRILDVTADTVPTPELYFSLVHRDDRSDVKAAVSGALTRGHFEHDLRIVQASGEQRWIHAKGRTGFDRSGRAERMTGIAHDITDRKQSELELVRLALHDGLTGLANWTLFRDRLGHALETRPPATVAVLIVDLDDFKLVNDTLGHAAGDRLLQVVATRITSALRPADTVARLGGDEFAVLLEGTDADGARAAAVRMLEVLGAPVLIGEREHQVSASIGVAAGQPWIDRDEVLRAADIAMYEAKGRGKGRVVLFVPEMQQDITEREVLKQRLRRAIAGSGLRVAYQPLFDLRSDRIVAVEALVRWDDGEHGEMPPSAFIPLAEATGLIIDVDRWVLATALDQLRRWREDGLPAIRLAVNVSVLTLEDARFPEHVRRSLAASGADPRMLELEVTESALSRDIRHAVLVIGELREMGIEIAIDDFGTGYSTLARLKALPFDTLKIDRSFVQEIGEASSSPLLRAMVGIGRALGVRVVGEGIETEAQLEYLRAQGCQEGQGFLFSPAVAPDAVAHLLASPTDARSAAA